MTRNVLTGKTAIVTGSGRNIGRAIAVELARLGSNVVVSGSSDRAGCEATAEAAAALGVESLVAMGDVSKSATVAAIAEAALGRFGAVDIVVNNAAIRPHKPFLEMSDEDWQKVIDLDLTSAFFTCRAFLPAMVERNWGRVVNITGMKAIRGYSEGAPISAAKHGLWGMTKALSQEFAARGITANAVSPGPIKVDGRDGADPKQLAGIPAGFMGDPEDIAALVCFLASPGGRFVNGQMISANGGGTT
ncbi:MAG: SDR family oxidoreductase [Kiloniellaceae bacterium]